MQPKPTSSRVDDLFLKCFQLEPDTRSAFLNRECGADETEIRHAVERLLKIDAQLESDEPTFLPTPKFNLRTTMLNESPPPFDDADPISLTHKSSTGGTQRIPIRCPHCRDIVTVLNEDRRDEQFCDSCGRQIELDSTPTSTDPSGADLPRINHFQLLELCGEGAFGKVWRASDTRLNRVVAVKVPRQLFLNETGTDKFLHEARMVAQLQHDNIVRVYEVGRCEETVYIVSDFIDGLTLQELGQSGRLLSCTEAAEMCRQIADALHYAHEKGVIHRDLKPANIIVDSQMKAHVTDFGMARQIAADASVSASGKVFGTPAYMSPEQACGEGHAADRRSDVYSTGVILYELLVHERPFRGDVNRLIQQVRYEEPQSPRRLNSNVSRDLETICLRCLQKEPSSRYATASDLSNDLRHYLAGRPIIARPISRAERIVKLCRRNPATASIASALVVAVALGFYLTTSQWVRAEANLRLARRYAEELKQERDQAEIHLTEATAQHAIAEQNLKKGLEAVNTYFITASDQLQRNSPNHTPLRRKLLESGLRYFREFLDANRDNPELKAEVAATYLRISRICIQIGSRDALPALNEGIDRLEELVNDPAANEHLPEILSGIYQGGEVSEWAGEDRAADFREAYRLLLRAYPLCQLLVERYPNHVGFQSDLASVANDRGHVEHAAGFYEKALASRFEAKTMWTDLAQSDPTNEFYRTEVARCELHLGQTLYRLRDHSAAIVHIQEAIKQYESLLRDTPGVPDYRLNLGLAHHILGDAFGQIGKNELAHQELRRSLEIREQLTTQYPTVHRYHHDIGSATQTLALIAERGDNWQEAVKLRRQVLTLRQNLVDTFPDVQDYFDDLANAHTDLGRALAKVGPENDLEARQNLEEGIAIWERLVKAAPKDLDQRLRLMEANVEFAQLLFRTGETAAAEQQIKEATELAARHPEIPATSQTDERQRLEAVKTALQSLQISPSS